MKKLLALILSAAMTFTCAGITVTAAGNSNAQDAVAQLGEAYYSSVQLAIADAKENDTIYVLKDIETLGTIDKAVKIEGRLGGAEGAKVTLSGNAGEAQFGTIDGTVTIENFIYEQGTQAVRVEYASCNYTNMNLVINKCEFKNIDGYSIMGGSGWQEIVLGGLEITDSTFTVADGATAENYIIYAQRSKNVTITGNTIIGNENAKGAIHLGDGIADANTSSTVKENIITGFKRAIVIAASRNENTVVIEKNTFEDIGDGAIYLHENINEGTAEIKAVNNKVTDDSKIVYNDNSSDDLLPEDIITVFNGNTVGDSMVDINGEPFTPVAKIGDIYYGSLPAAIDAAEDNDEITLTADAENPDITVTKDITINLGGYTVNEAYIKVSGNVEIKNGSIVNVEEAYPLIVQNGGALTVTDVDIEASKSDRAIWVRDNSTLNFNSGNILATKGVNNKKYQIVGIWVNTNSTVNLNGGNITVDAGDSDDAIGIYGNYTNADVNMTAGKISTSGDNYSYGICVDGDVNVSGGEIVTNEKEYAYSSGIHKGFNYAIYNKGNVTISGGKITTYGHSGYLVNAAGSEQEINISDVDFENILNAVDIDKGGHKNPPLISASSAVINISGGSFDGISETLVRGSDSTISVTGGEFSADITAYLAPGYQLSRTANGYGVKEAEKVSDSISVEFEDISDTEGERKYNIVLKANDSDEINEFASTDLTFVFTSEAVNGGEMAYIIVPAEGITLTQIEDRYMFNCNGETYEITGNVITLGTLTVSGYGSFTFKTAEAGTNVVNATTLMDNLVDYYVADGDTDDDDSTGKLIINTDTAADDYIGSITDTITVPERTLKINITFPNAVEYKDAAYQDMTVTIVGGTIDEEIELGADEEDYTITRDLPYNTAYTVTVSGAGYRTARYTVTLTDDKELKFWNNVMDNKLEVEEGKAASAVTKNFLAGDIVKDNNINIYDLSAVVSYFGTEKLVEEHPEYAKYDLNRDGVIDSKDVAYVLVSWGE